MKVRYTYEGVNDCFHNFGVVVRGNDKNGNMRNVEYGFREFDVESWYGQGFLARFIRKYGENVSHSEFEKMFEDRNYTHPGEKFYGGGDAIYRFGDIRKAIDGIWYELNGSKDGELLDGFAKMKDALWGCLYGLCNAAMYVSLDGKVMDNADVSAMSEEIATDVENGILERLSDLNRQNNNAMDEEEQRISYDTAKLMEEKIGGYDGAGVFIDDAGNLYNVWNYAGNGAVKLTEVPSDVKVYWCPTIYAAMNLLREAYKLHITVFSSSQESWMYRITRPHQRLEEGEYGEDFDSYEAACDAAIKHCLIKLI